MTLDEAVHAAEQLLAQRGQLLNGHLLRLVDGDKELFRDVRERLIAEGIAEDRSGIGLARIERSTKSGGEPSLAGTSASDSNPPSTALMSTVAEWWLMSAGTIRGPLNLVNLCQMRRTGEIKTGDVVRCTDQGRWQNPDEVPDLFSARPVVDSIPDSFRIGQRLSAEREAYGTRSRHRFPSLQSPSNREPTTPQNDLHSENQENASQQGVSSRPNLQRGSETDIENDLQTSPAELASTDDIRFVPPEKILALAKQRQPGWLTRGWNIAADLAGGDGRLKIILAVVVAAGLLIYWWKQPPAAQTIYNEFTACRAAVLKLQDRRAKRSEWAPVVERYRPRVQSFVNRLRSRATDRYPLQQALYSAGSLGLLPLLENPMDPTPAERAFDQYMATAHELLDTKNSVRTPTLNVK